ncbi:MAG: gamma-glutamylcyclotransferase [FCB group bacterium]|nr:gamma-glutamylcyclotransferase [FCB group bacterium]
MNEKQKSDNGNQKNKLTLYFAYGANLNLDGMAYRCPGFKPIGPALLPNYRFAFKGVADVEPALGESVYGAIYLLTPAHMQALDRFEGFPNLYIKKQAVVRVLDNINPKHFTMATIYIMRNGDRCAEPSWQYLDIILNGCRQWNLPEDYQDEIQRRAYHPHLITKKELFSLT